MAGQLVGLQGWQDLAFAGFRVPQSPSTLPVNGDWAEMPLQSSGTRVQILGGVQKREAQAAPPLPNPCFPLSFRGSWETQPTAVGGAPTARKGLQNFAASAKGREGIGPSGWGLLCPVAKGGGGGRRLNSFTASGGNRGLVTGACLAPSKRLKFSYVENPRQPQAVRN